ncbi:hypothetical protein [Cupriavidus agavae]|uniref:Uncharacterized protein n=1 Tax=Cupriavidus agavae TaxID=1001822 RepID=A0A4Q7RXH8_9BURK|nr:hypothetical protein [Cupriavidus agavae]RZT38583.1 hypothetical protein EV147_3052 [Cupriavidus agavae]
MRTDFPLLSRWRARGVGVWPALWLVACLLLAQHAGLVHRVVHGGLPAVPQAAAALASPTHAAHAHGGVSFLKLGLHSCVLFDGATLADTHSGSFALPQLAFGKPVKPANLAWRWPDLPAARPFHSRAPPFAFDFA